MKIRTDFVTNSSSVSYILTMYKDMVDSYVRYLSLDEKDKDTKTANAARIIRLLREDMEKNGTCVFLEGKEIITKRVKFSTDETLTDQGLDKPLEKMSDEELWPYIYGKYILEGKICSIWGFGATQIETY